MTKTKLPAIQDLDFKSIYLDVDGFDLNMKERELALALVLKCYTKETISEIGDRIGYSVDTIYKMPQRKPDFKRFQQYLYEQLFQDLYGKAIVILHEIIDNAPSPSTKLKAVEMILKAHGKFKSEHNLTVEQKRNITLEDLENEFGDAKVIEPIKTIELEVKELEKELLED